MEPTGLGTDKVWLDTLIFTEGQALRNGMEEAEESLRRWKMSEKPGKDRMDTIKSCKKCGGTGFIDTTTDRNKVWQTKVPCPSCSTADSESSSQEKR